MTDSLFDFEQPEEIVTVSTEPRIFRVPESNMPHLQKRLEKLVKRAGKLGVTPPAFVESGSEFVLRFRQGSIGRWSIVGLRNGETNATAQARVEAQAKRTRTEDLEFGLERYILGTVVGAAPKLNGWSFVSAVEHTEAGNILRMVPPYLKESLPVVYRTAARGCEHCRADRFRKDTYIVHHEDGRFQQVGRNCLRDFTGHADPNALAAYAELLAELGDYLTSEDWEEGGGGHERPYWQLSKVLELAAAVIRLDGWVSRAKAEELQRNPTSSSVATLLYPSRSDKDREAKQFYATTEHDVELAAAALAWAQTLPEDAGNDYLWNLRVIAHLEAIDGRKLGLACAMVASYMREKEMEMRRKLEDARPSNHFGTIKKREVFTVTLVSITPIEGNYGLTNIHRFVDPTGNIATWFASSGGSLGHWNNETGEKEGPKEGDTFQIKATVTSHEEFRGKKQTMLSRVALENWSQPALAVAA